MIRLSVTERKVILKICHMTACYIELPLGLVARYFKAHMTVRMVSSRSYSRIAFGFCGLSRRLFAGWLAGNSTITSQVL